MNRTAKILLAVLAVLYLGLGGYYWWSQKGIVASVNGKAIRKDQFDKTLEQVSGHEVLQRMISEQLVQAAAKAKNVTVTDAEVKTAMDRLAGQFGTQADFQKALKDNGLTEEDAKKDLTTNLTLDKLSKQGVTVSDAEIQKYFEENKASLGQPEEVKVRQILVQTEAEANQILADLKANKDFAQLAKEKSLDKVSGQQGGELGFFSRGKMVKEFEDAAFSLPVGEYSKPVKTNYGYHILQVEEKKPAQQATLEGSKVQIRDILMQQKAKPQDALLNELLSQATIDVRDARFKDLAKKPQ